MSNKGLLKWAGGKERELPILEQFFPKNIDNYYEPFVGGGSVYLNNQAKNYYINDLYGELYQFYFFLIQQNSEFKNFLRVLDSLWLDGTNFFEENIENFIKFMHVRHDQNSDLENFILMITDHFEVTIYKKKYSQYFSFDSDFKEIFYKVVKSKIQRILKHELSKGILNDEDLKKNFKSAIKAAIYTYIRKIYNDYRKKGDLNNTLYIACFYFIRNYCYASMFRFNASNEFNVPYGGLSYNEQYLNKKIEYFYSLKNIEFFSKTNISNCDFEIFLKQHQYSQNDFIFLDPPYDSAFSDYESNAFTENDQIRLANLLYTIQAKFLLVIKRTEFIESLYCNRPNLIVEVFEKKYQVSFKNRNNKNVEHLIIRNY